MDLDPFDAMDLVDPDLLRRLVEMFSGAFPDMDEVVDAALAAGPRSAWDLARLLEASAPGVLEEREGFLYPLLARRVREGSLAARWTTDRNGNARRVYGRTGDARHVKRDPGEPGIGEPTIHSVLEASADDAARAIPGAFERESARVEMLGHLRAAAAAYARLGHDPEEASACALRGFGDIWKIRTDLGRVHRGRPVVLFPRTVGARLRSAAIYDLVPIALAVAVVFLLRWQVVQAFNIPTSSMAPTLHGSDVDPDFILVDKTAFRRREPLRWEILVFYPPQELLKEDPSAFVKRCVGLGGEWLDIRGGDVYADDRLARRPLEVEDSMMVGVYDLGGDLRDVAERDLAVPGELPRAVFGRTWRERTGGWALDGDRLEARPGEEGEARLAFTRRVTNSYVDVDGRRMDRGSHGESVGDAEVRFRVTPGAEGSVVGADLTEGADRHCLRIGRDKVVLRSGDLVRTHPAPRGRPGRPMDVSFRNVDDRLTVRIDGRVVLREELPPRAVVPVDAEPAGVELVTEGGPAVFSRVAILRDVHYMRYGTDSGWPRKVPTGHLFMMGDNTASSNDSRMWGPVDENALIGSPFVVLYPLTRFKRLPR